MKKFWKSNSLRKYWKSQPIRLLGNWGLGWFSSLSTFFLSLLVGAYFDLQFQSGTGKSLILEKFGVQFSNFYQLFLVMAVLLIGKITFQYLERIATNHIADQFVANLHFRLFKKQMNWTPDFFSKRQFSQYLLKFSGDLSPIRNLLVNGIHRGARDLLFISTGICLLLWISPYWTIWVLGTVALFIPIFYWIDSRQIRIIPEKRNLKNNLFQFVTNSFLNHREIHSQLKIQKTVRRFTQKNKALLALNLTYHRWESLRHALGNGISPLLIFFILVLISIHWNQESSGTLLAYFLLLNSLGSPLRNLLKSPEIIEKGMISLRKIEQTLKTKPNPTLSESKSKRQEPTLSIQAGLQ